MSVSKISRHIREWIIDQANVGEESITDYLLWQIKLAVPNTVYKKWTKKQENANGADWDWYIITNAYTAQLTIQAKRLKSPGKNYTGINHDSGNQINNLLQIAAQKNFLPLFALYSREDGDACRGKVTGEGVQIAAAQKVSALHSAAITTHKIQTKDLLADAIPLSCLFNCPSSGSGMNPQTGIPTIFELYFDVQDNTTKFLVNGIPRHIQFLLSEHPNTSEDTDDLLFSKEDGQQKDIENFSVSKCGLLISDLRKYSNDLYK